MAHEKINHPADANHQIVIGWHPIGWVQLSLYPEGWSHTGDAAHVPLTPPEIDKLIKTLKRAKRQAYGQGHRHEGFSDRAPMPTGSDLFT